MNEYGNNGNGSWRGRANPKPTQMDDVGNGLDRLSLQKERRANVVDKETLKVAGILRGSKGDSQRTANNVVIKAQLNELLFYLGREGNWKISKYGNNVKPLLDDDKKGVEADVYLWNDDGEYKVIKVSKWWVRHQTPLEFVENKIIAHNIIFPQTAYWLIGIQYDRGDFLFVLEQSYVRSMKGVKVTQQEIDEDMKKRGFDKDGSAYYSDNYIISDLNSKNVLKGVDNELYYIDPIIYPKTKITKYISKKNQ